MPLPYRRHLARCLTGAAATAILSCRPEATTDRGAPVSQSAAASATTAPLAPPTSATAPGAAPTSSAPRAPQGAPAKPGAGRVAFNFEDADLPELVRLVGSITGKRFILTGSLPAVHATVISPEPVTVDEAYGAFLAILQSNGLTVVQRGEYWKILPSPGVPPERGAGR